MSRTKFMASLLPNDELLFKTAKACYSILAFAVFLYMLFYALSALVNALASFASGFFVFLKNRRNSVHVTFAIFSLSIFWWSVGYLFWQNATTAGTALLWTKFFMAGAIFIPPSFLHFALAFLGNDKKWRYGIFTAYLLAGLFIVSILLPQSLFISGVTARESFPFWPIPGIAFHFFMLYWGCVVLGAFLFLLRGIKESSGLRRAQVQYIFWGAAIGFLGGSTNYFLWYSIPILPIGNILVAAYIVGLAIVAPSESFLKMRVIAMWFFAIAFDVLILFMVLVAESSRERISNVVLLVFASLFGFFLIRSVLKEVEQTEQAKKLLDMRSEFLTIASHQLKTPVTLIMGILSMMREGSLDKATPEERKNFIDGAYEKAVKLSDIIRDILFASDFDTKEFTIPEKNLVPVDVDTFLVKLHADFKERAEKKGLILSYENRVQAQCNVLTDPRYLLQAMTNIMDNAIKYTLRGSITLILEGTDSSAIITIRDTGVGVPLADQAKIFGKFNRASNAVDMYTDGSGLGLYIAKEIINAHEDGKIVMNSKEGAGTEFVVTLKRATQSSS